MSNYKIQVDETGDYPHFYNDAGKYLSVIRQYENGDVLALTEAGDEAMYYAHEFAIEEPAQVEEETDEESKRKRMWAELDALTEMMVRDSIIQDHLIAEEVKNVRARLAAQKQESEQPEEPAHVATKVEVLAANLKHLDKPGRRETPKRSWALDTTHAYYIQGFYWGRKAQNGRNKLSGNFGRYDMRVERELDALIHDTRPSRFFEGETVRTPRQSQAIRDGYWRWFPVALENTVFHPAVACHYLQYFIANTRHYSNLTRYVATTCRDNKAQVNRYHALKTW